MTIFTVWLGDIVALCIQDKWYRGSGSNGQSICAVPFLANWESTRLLGATVGVRLALGKCPLAPSRFVDLRNLGPRKAPVEIRLRGTRTVSVLW